MALTTPCSVTLYQRSVEWWFTKRRSFCPWQSKRRACGAGCWRRNIRCPNICLCPCLSFCPSALPLIFFSLLFVHLSISASTSHLYFFMLSILFVVFSFLFFVGGWGRGECLTILSSIQSSIFIFLNSSSHLSFWFLFCHPLIHPPIQSAQSSTSLSHYTAIVVCLPFSFLHALTYSVCPVIHRSITLCIHCCVFSCPVSPFFTHSPIQSIQSSTGLSHYTSIAVCLPVLFLHSSL